MVFAVTALVVALASLSSVTALRRGLAWATDNEFANNIAYKPQIGWYHHWAMPPVPQMSHPEYVPMFWGPSQWGSWNDRLQEMYRNHPKHVMAFNEPDVSSQSNMNPYEAAQIFMEQIQPWANRGALLGSPAIVWDLNWMATFLEQIHHKGGDVHFICLHWYGSWNDLEGLKQYVETAHNRFGKPIWITEIGITTGSWPSHQQVKSFMMNAISWMESQSYVQRVSWFGCFTSNNPPDGFATGKNALFNPGGSLSDNGFWYSYSSNPSKRSVQARHRILSRDDDEEPTGPVVHCDETCQKRKAQLDEYLASVTNSTSS